MPAKKASRAKKPHKALKSKKLAKVKPLTLTASALTTAASLTNNPPVVNPSSSSSSDAPTESLTLNYNTIDTTYTPQPTTPQTVPVYNPQKTSSS